MPNGTLKLYNKQTNALLVTLDILGTFNIEDNLNETPSNMKVKVITTNTYREEFEVNTVAYHEDTNTWWVIKSDESTYLMTGEYEHEIQLVEYLEFYAYRHLPNCAFAPNTYDLEDMLNRLFDIAKISVTVTYPSFLDKDKLMPFMSFENYTVANAIKHIARAINAIPKMSVSLSPSYQPQLTFINRNGLDTAIVETLNTQFPIAYEKNLNSTDQFTTRSVSNITNAKSTSLVIAPKEGGFKNVVPNSITFDNDNREEARIILPSKIDKVEYVNIVIPVYLYYTDSTGVNGTFIKLYRGYYTSKEPFITALQNSGLFGAGQVFTTAQLQDAIDKLPDPKDFYKVTYNQEVDKTFRANSVATSFSVFHKKMSLLDKFSFDTVSKIVSGNTQVDTDKKDRTIHWLPFSNEIIMSKSFRNSLSSEDDHNIAYYLLGSSTNGDDAIYLVSDVFNFNITNKTVIYNEDIMIQVAYYPIADIKVSIDNDNNAQDEKYFNQSGKVIDSVAVTKLITSHTNDSVDGTKIRNARYTSLASILPIGQIVRDNNLTYVITQRSIDAQVKNGNEYYNVIYTLSRNRVARSENIVADSAVISYKTPDDNLVFRTQLYKDYIELSLTNITPKDTPYLSMSKGLVLSSTLAGTNFDFTVLAKNEYGNTPTIVRYVKNPTVFDLHKAKLTNVNWQDNNVLGFRLSRPTGAFVNTVVQTPIVYTDNTGKATNFEVLFLNEEEIKLAKEDYNSPTVIDELVPFTDLTLVPQSFYDTDVVTDGRYSIRIQENADGGKPYKKDPFEIPVFEYMIQANDDYNSNGNIVVGNDLFTTFDGDIRYHYIINNTTRFTAENADRLRALSGWTTLSDRRAVFVRTNATTISMTLYSSYDPSTSPPTLTTNTSDIVNVGVFAVDSISGKNKFLFAINDYAMASKHLFTIYINNWKI